MTHNPEFINMVRTFIIAWAHRSFVQILVRIDPTVDITNTEIKTSIWNKVFETILPQMKYLVKLHRDSGFEYLSKNSSVRLFSSGTMQDYIDTYVDFKKMGPYSYIDFQKSMKNAEFVRQIKIDYENYENNKHIKNDILSGVYEYISNGPVEVINAIPFYEYIACNAIVLDEKPEIVNFRTKKADYYELYTLWCIQQYLS